MCGSTCDPVGSLSRDSFLSLGGMHGVLGISVVTSSSLSPSYVGAVRDSEGVCFSHLASSGRQVV